MGLVKQADKLLYSTLYLPIKEEAHTDGYMQYVQPLPHAIAIGEKQENLWLAQSAFVLQINVFRVSSLRLVTKIPPSNRCDRCSR